MQVLETKRPLLPYPATIRVKKVPLFDLFQAKRAQHETREKEPRNCHESLI